MDIFIDALNLFLAVIMHVLGKGNTTATPKRSVQELFRN